MQKTHYIFLASDGDNVGSTLEYFILMNDLKALAIFSQQYKNQMSQLAETIKATFNGEIIFDGGDNLLAKIPLSYFNIDKMNSLRTNFSSDNKYTLSFGIGKTPREAHIALSLAKASGKNCTKLYWEMPNE